MGFGAPVGEVVEQGTGGAAGIVRAQLFQHRPLKSFHQFPVRLFFLQPIEGQAEEPVQGFQIGIRFGRLFDGLGKVSGRQDPGVGLAQAGTGVNDPGLAEMVKRGPAGGFPTDLALMKQVKMAPHGTAGFGRTLGQGSDHPVVAGQPDGQQAGFSLAAEMEQNPFILKRLAQAPTLAEGANREDKRDDSGEGNV